MAATESKARLWPFCYPLLDVWPLGDFGHNTFEFWKFIKSSCKLLQNNLDPQIEGKVHPSNLEEENRERP